MDPLEQQHRNSFSNFWEKFTGDGTSFSMENRLFNAVSVITLIVIFFSAVNNFILNIPGVVVLLAVFVLQAILYYFSRVKKIYIVPAIIYCLATYSYLIYNYFVNAGIAGPTIMGFISSFILIVALGPVSWHKIWIVLHILVVSALLALEYFNVGTYQQYAARQDHFIDMGLTFIVSILYMYFVVLYIRNNYLREKRLAAQYAQSMQKQNEELAELNQVKNRLFSIVSHDLRSPLNSIQGYLEVLADQQLPEAEKNKIQQQLLLLTRHTQDMLFNLLSWSRSQLAGNVVELQPVNISETMEATIEILKNTAAKKNIALNNLIDPLFAVMADADMLQLIIRNLLHNAIKFTSAEGEISVGTLKQGDNIHIFVKDNGTGIPPDKQAILFSSRLKSARGTNKETGIGLGLFLCKQLTELQHGQIWYNGRQGGGSEFVLSLPASI